MNTENEMNEDMRQLLDSLEEHGKNARRQQQLSDLIDGLSGKEFHLFQVQQPLVLKHWTPLEP